MSVADSVTMNGSRIGFFGVSFSLDATAIVNTDGWGCPANFGSGKGLYFDSLEQCAPSGASQANYGGTGLPSSLNGNDINTCTFYLEQTRNLLKNYPYSIVAANEVRQEAGRRTGMQATDNLFDQLGKWRCVQRLEQDIRGDLLGRCRRWIHIDCCHSNS